MRKSRSSQNGKRKKRASISSKHEDRISQLPDDILISIISRLTLREATATSILSIRWRYLCTYTTHLVFPPQPEPIYVENDIQKRRRSVNYTNIIDRVLDSHKGGRVKEFRVSARYLVEGANIGKWLEFALAKEVEIIDLRLWKYPLGHTNLINGQQSRGIQHLKELTLSSVDVDDRELELLLCKFPFLESLSIRGSKTLRNASIVGHSASKLKHLDISCAPNVELIKIDSLMSLISLRCHGFSIFTTYSLILNNVPKLIEFSTLDQMKTTVPLILARMPSCIRDQLQTLKVFWNFDYTKDYKRLDIQCIGIKNLELHITMWEHVTSLSDLFYLIQACPSLEKLEIKMVWLWWSRELKVKVNEDSKTFAYSLAKIKLSPNLKKVKFVGFVGSQIELEFAYSIMRNVKALEELAVEVCDDSKKIRTLATHRAYHHFRPTMLSPPFTLVVM